MDQSLRSRIGNILSHHFRQKKELAGLQDTLKTVEQRMEATQKTLLDAESLIPSTGVAGNLIIVTDRRQMSDPTWASYNVYQKNIAELRSAFADLMNRKISLTTRILKLQDELEGVQSAIDSLTAEEQRIVELKYTCLLSHPQIGIELSMAESSVRYRLQSIFEQIDRFLCSREAE